MNETIATKMSSKTRLPNWRPPENRFPCAGSVRRSAGSLKNIADMLRALTEKRRQSAEIARERSEIPASVHEAVETLILHVWRAAQAETQAFIDAVEQRRAHEIGTHHAERERLLEELENQEDELKSAHEEIERSAATVPS